MSERRAFDQSEPMTLRIEKPVYGGAGLARHDGRVVFTPFTLPGESVTAHVTYVKTSFAEARLNSVLEPSARRVAAPCPYFGVCGGCHYQHAAYDEQLAIKRAILTETLTRARLTALPEIVTHAGQPFGYRSRVRLHLDAATSALGYRERGSHRLLAVEQCPIAAPKVEDALKALVSLCTEQGVGPVFSEVELSTNDDGSELLMALWLRPGASRPDCEMRLGRLCEGIQKTIPWLKGAGVHAPPYEESRPSGRALKIGRRAGSAPAPRASLDKSAAGGGDDEGQSPGELVAVWGNPHMTYRVSGFDYRVSLGAFFQVNRTLVDELVALVTSGRNGALAWDLYAGVGLFSRVLAQRFAQVVAVEGSPIAAKDLAINLGLPHQPVQASTAEFLRRHLAGQTNDAAGRGRPGYKRQTPDFVLVDPPRAGMGTSATRSLSEIGPRTITYVSCDPATLARDLHAFVESGYQLQQLHLIDLFPQTFHLEAVATLSLG